MDYKPIILNMAFVNDSINKSFTCRLSKNKIKYCNIINYILTYFDENSNSIREGLYRIKYNIDKIPLCPVCKKPLKFIGKSNKIYTSHCSNRCKKLDKSVQSKFFNSCKEKYGEGNITNRKKAIITCIEKYGVKNPFQIEDIKNKIKENNRKYFDEGITQEKIITTCLSKYGTKYYFQTEEFKTKRIKTSLNKYNTTYPIQHDSIKSKYDRESINKKRYITLSKNNSWNISNKEEQSYIILREKYPDVIRQYRSEAYPFNCDFYIPLLDLYIECNYHWTHGEHQFDCNNQNDIYKLEIWKSKNSKYYDNAIETWTIRDINKHNIAKKNNLNYICFYNYQEFMSWINNT